MDEMEHHKRQKTAVEVRRIADAVEPAYDRNGISPLIICLTPSLSLPAFCAVMPRIPAPPTGSRLNPAFADDYLKALKINPEVHDGAIVAGRAEITDEYQVLAWSCRLFPPALGHALPPNRGSAYHSALSISSTLNIDAVILFSRRELTIFVDGVQQLHAAI